LEARKIASAAVSAAVANASVWNGRACVPMPPAGAAALTNHSSSSFSSVNAMFAVSPPVTV
jgi:hypothetical protein